MTGDANYSRVEDDLIPRLDAREVAAVFSEEFERFLRSEDTRGDASYASGAGSSSSARDKHTKENTMHKTWYEGTWTEYHATRWRNHSFQVPVDNQKVAWPRKRTTSGGSVERLEVQDQESINSFRVWGMTARMVIDAARLAYAVAPGFEVRTARKEGRKNWTNTHNT